MEPKIAEIISHLDKMASEVEKENPVVALALDRISDQLEREATAGDIGRKMIDWIKSIRPMPKDEQLAQVIETLRENPMAKKEMSKLVENLLGAGLNPLSRGASEDSDEVQNKA